MRLALLLIALTLNVVTFAVYGLDKWKARRGSRRIPEAHLLWLAAVGGAPGAWFAMGTFRHKTQKKSFRWRFFAASAFCVAWVGGLFWIWLRSDA